jgi:DNA-binding NarL/FixJ family response regulator
MPRGVLWTALVATISPRDMLTHLPPSRSEDVGVEVLASGLANNEVAGRLAISEHTVQFPMASILGKLGAMNRTKALTIGICRSSLAIGGPSYRVCPDCAILI